MSIQVSCPGRECDQTLTLSPDMAGKKGKCPKCGMSFQIPKNLGAGKATQSSSTARPAAKPPTATPKPKSRPRRGPEKIDADEMASMLVDDDDDADFVEESVEDYNDYASAPRRRPRRRERDDYDDDDDRDEDDYVPRRRGGKSGGMSKATRWKLTSVGMLIVAISMCVIGGATALTFISELLFQIATASVSTGTGKAAYNIMKIAQVFALLGGVGLMVGYVFSVFVPNRYGSMGLSIAAIVLGVANFVLQLIFVQIPTLRDRIFDIQSRAVHAGFFGGGFGGGFGSGDEVLSFFLELGRAAEFLVYAFFLAAAARTLGDRRQRQDCMRVVYFLAGFAGLILVTYIFMFIGDGSSGKWLLYVVRILNWLANGLIGTVLVFYIMNLFYSAKNSE